MNVYDFDGTVRRGDTSADFYLFELRRHPAIALDLPRVGWSFLRYKLGRIALRDFKQVFFAFLRRVPDLEADLALFREKNRDCLDAWYLAQARPDDVIITASPEWLVAPLIPGATVIGTRVDQKTGAFDGENCKGEEKVARLRLALGDGALTEIEKFYSDSRSDTPLALLAREACLVGKDCTLSPWNQA